MKNLLPVLFIGADYDDFSIFHLAVQEIDQQRKVLWLQCPYSFINNPIPVCCIVVDVPARPTLIEMDLFSISNYAKEADLPLFLYTTDPLTVAPKLNNIPVKAIMPKYVQFEKLVAHLKKRFCTS